MKNRLDYLTSLIDKYLVGVDREASEAIKEVKDALPSCYDVSPYNDALDLNRKLQIQVQKLIDARDNQMHQEGQHV